MFNKNHQNPYLDIKLDKAINAYYPDDYVSGQVIVMNLKQRIQNLGFSLKSYGCDKFNNRLQQYERALNTVPTANLFGYDVELTNDKFISEDNSKFSFKFQLKATETEKLIESYLGVFIQCEYVIKVLLKTSMDQEISHSINFNVQVKNSGIDKLKIQSLSNPYQIMLKPGGIMDNKTGKRLPTIQVQFFIKSLHIKINDEFEGSFIVDECESEIKSIDLQLIRVEEISSRIQEPISQTTEIQWIQIAEGNQISKYEIPFSMIFPKLFSCPNFTYKQFTVNFEINLILILIDGFKITHNFPINIIR